MSIAFYPLFESTAMCVGMDDLRQMQMDCFDKNDEQEKTLTEVISSADSGFAYLTQFGRLSQSYEHEFSKLHVYGGGLITTHGVIKDGKFLPNTTFYDIYRGRFAPDYMAQLYENELKASRTQLDPVDNAIFVAHLWDQNYQHFLIEVFPRLWMMTWFREFDNIPFVVSDHAHIRDLLSIAFPDRVFIYIKPGTELSVKGRIFYPSAVAINMGWLPDVAARALFFLRTKVLTHQNGRCTPQSGPTAKVFFGRTPDPKYQGNSRVMVNYADFIDLISQESIDIRDFDNKTVLEKADQVRDVRLAISPMGANLMNFIFMPFDVKIIVIEHPIFKVGVLFPALFKALGFNPDNIKVFSNVSLPDGAETKDNAPYILDIDLFKNFLQLECRDMT